MSLVANSAYNTDFNDDGFQIKNTNPRWNTNGETYIYAAFAEKPDQSVIDSLIDYGWAIYSADFRVYKTGNICDFKSRHCLC